MNWRTKAAMMRFLDAAPFGDHLHYAAQKYLTHTLPISEESFAESIDLAQSHINAFRAFGTKSLEQAHFYEFGAGWDLRYPIIFHCLGVGHQTVVDLNPHARLELINHAIRRLMTRSDLTSNRLSELSSNWKGELQSKFGITYIAPADARSLTLESGSVDCITSTSTLEHIPVKDIRLIYKECLRILAPGGVISFIIDYKDHYSYSDPSIGKYHFLRFTPEEWKKYSPGSFYQNRLRHKQHRALIEEAGFRIVSDGPRTLLQEEIEEASSSPLADEFKSFSAHDTAITVGHFVAVKN